MNVLVLTTQNSGVGYHRMLLPMTYMKGVYTRATDTMNDDVVADRKFDIMYINRYVQGYELDDVIAFKNKHGMKLIVDIDDYWELDSWHILYGTYPTQKIIDHIKAADYVTVTNVRLWKQVVDLKVVDVAILPNALPYGEDQFTTIRTESDRVRFNWVGSITHEKDIQILSNPMKRIQSDSEFQKNGEFIISGFTDHPVWHKMAAWFKGGKGKNFRIQTALDVYHYMNLYNDADVALAPLVESTFNMCKSNLKILEAGAKKIPIICQAIPPYISCPFANMARHQSDWYKQMKQMLQSSRYREERGFELHEWCREYHDLHKINQKRKEILDYVIQ